MLAIYIDDTLQQFDERSLSSKPDVRYRERLIVEAALRHPPAPGKRGGNRYDAVAAELNERGLAETSRSVHAVLTRICNRIRKQELTDAAAAVSVKELTGGGYAAQLADLIEFTRGSLETDPPDTERRQVFILADLHGFPNKALLPSIVRAHKQKLQTHFIYAGDLYDLFCSSGIGLVNDVPLKAAEFGETRYLEETKSLTAFFSAIHAEVPGAIHHILKGNHDEIVKLFPRTPFWALRHIVKDPLKELASLFSNTTVDGWNVRYIDPTGEVIENYKHVPYALIFGEDLFISHLNKTGGKPFESVNQTWAWIQDKRMVHGLNGIRCVLQAHSHKLSIQDVQGGHVRLVEIGFGGDPHVLRYQVGYNVWRSETSVGCVVLEQELNRFGQWITDLNSIQHLRP